MEEMLQENLNLKGAGGGSLLGCGQDSELAWGETGKTRAELSREIKTHQLSTGVSSALVTFSFELSVSSSPFKSESQVGNNKTYNKIKIN